jgi:LPXTG-site transpeptidase (sortase) family protein
MIIFKNLLFAVGIVGIAATSIMLLARIDQGPRIGRGDQSSQASASEGVITANMPFPKEVRPGLPVRLIIPSIGVLAPLVSVGVTKDGAMDVPKAPDEAAWYEPGPRPGEVGSAIISGHFGWKNSIPAIFDNLHKVKVSDIIYSIDDAGATTTFVVHEIRTLKEDEDASSVFGSSDGKAHLNLITCEGVWNKARKSYSNRLVVFADKVDE